MIKSALKDPQGPYIFLRSFEHITLRGSSSCGSSWCDGDLHCSWDQVVAFLFVFLVLFSFTPSLDQFLAFFLLCFWVPYIFFGSGAAENRACGLPRREVIPSRVAGASWPRWRHAPGRRRPCPRSCCARKPRSSRENASNREKRAGHPPDRGVPKAGSGLRGLKNGLSGPSRTTNGATGRGVPLQGKESQDPECQVKWSRGRACLLTSDSGRIYFTWKGVLCSACALAPFQGRN